MAYRRNYRSNRRRYKKRYRKKRRYGGMSTYRVKRIIGAELKKFDLAVGPLPSSSITGVITLLSNVPQGSTNITREGNWIRPVNIHGYIKCVGNLDAAAPVPDTILRVGIMRWRNDNSMDAPDIDRIMSDTSNPMCPFEIKEKGSFDVLYTRVIVLSNEVTNPNFQKLYKFYIKLSKGPKAYYDGELTAKKFQYYFFSFSDQPAETDPPTVEWCSSLRFTDS